jgi:hypothetical protein
MLESVDVSSNFRSVEMRFTYGLVGFETTMQTQVVTFVTGEIHVASQLSMTGSATRQSVAACDNLHAPRFGAGNVQKRTLLPARWKWFLPDLRTSVPKMLGVGYVCKQPATKLQPGKRGVSQTT